MLKLPHNCTHLTHWQSNAQNSRSQALTVSEYELPDVWARFIKGRGTRDQIAYIHWIIEKARAFQKNIYFCFIDYTKAFDCVDHNKLWTTLKEMGIPDDFTVSWETSMLVKKQQLELGMEHLTGSDFLKRVLQGWILSPCLFNFYVEDTMQNAHEWTLGWMKHKLGSGLLGEISTTSDTQMPPPLWQ